MPNLTFLNICHFSKMIIKSCYRVGPVNKKSLREFLELVDLEALKKASEIAAKW